MCVCERERATDDTPERTWEHEKEERVDVIVEMVDSKCSRAECV